MYVTATEFKSNFGKYLELISKEDVFITKNGRPIAKLVNPNVSVIQELRGIISLPKDMKDMDDKELIRSARLERYDSIN